MISPRRSGRGRKGIVIHECRLEEYDWQKVRSIPCATAARTIVDLAPHLDQGQVESLLVQADSLRILNRHRMEELARTRHGRPGTARIMHALGLERVTVRSPAEAGFLAICSKVGAARPLVNQRIEVAGQTFEVDFCWPEIRLIIEVDGYAFHGGRERVRADRDRDQTLALAGWSPHRFPADRIASEPEFVGRRLLELIELAQTKN